MRLIRIALAACIVGLVLTGGAGAYPWPFKPFDKQHPIRGFFGDPRAVYQNGVLSGPFDGPGFFSFHQGVDIVARDGTPIYPVVSGVAHYIGAATLNVDAGSDRVFQYFHIVPIVGEGQQVVARQTVIGYVQPPYGHVHLTEINGTHAVNPLERGHLAPYFDGTRPTIRDVLFRNQTGVLDTPLGLCGRVALAADAYDTTPVPVPGKFHGLPVSPAVVRWSIARAGDGANARWHTAADFRTTLPANGRFWNVYAKGTYENAPRFGAQQYAGMPGRYLFLLAGNFDTTSLSNGVYQLGVQAADERGNTATLWKRFSVLNARQGVCPGSLAAAPATTPPPVEPPADGSGGGGD
jgi:hypothetical protein